MSRAFAIKSENQNKIYLPQKNDKNVAFNGVVDCATKVLSACDKYPMLNVSAIDAVTAIIPRTALDAKTNGFAAFETFRRESSGLIVNCLIPSFIVLGIAKLADGTIFKNSSRKLKMSSVWANQKSIETLSGYYQQAKGSTEKEKVTNYIRNVISDISGADGKEQIRYSDSRFNFDKTITEIADAITDNSKNIKKTVKNAYQDIVSQTRAAEILKLKDKPFGSNLSELLSDMAELGRRFKTKEVNRDFAAFTKKATKLVNTKSILGLSVILPLAMSVQSINRWITKKVSGSDGAPIYKDFGKKQNSPTVERDKTNLKRNKLLAVGAMLGVTVASMLEKPTMGMFQFKGMFPTMNQCRWISASTFCSRMAVAEDNNELRETFIRDTITFASLYWLGDYASKLTAKCFEKFNPKIKLMNYSKLSKPNDNVVKKSLNWLRNVHLKSFDEVAGNVKVKNARTICQLAGFGFSTLVLGFLLPKYTRMQTEKKEIAFKKMQAKKNAEKFNQLFHLKQNNIPAVFQKFSGQQQINKQTNNIK